jgi:type VI secretion system protein VasJ
MKVDLDQIVAQSLAPLEGDSPAGVNARYEQEYEQVRAEISKLTAVAAGEEGIDWETVISGSAKLLAETSKDLNLAGYLSLALLWHDQYPGLRAGLKVFNGLVDDFWDTAFPEARRVKARVNVYQWLDDRLGEAVGAVEPDADQAEALDDCLRMAQKLAGEAGDKLQVPVTGLSGLRQGLSKWTEQYPVPGPEQAGDSSADQDQADGEASGDEAASAEQRPSPPSRPAAAPAASPPGDAGLALPETIDQGVNTLRPFIHHLRSLDPSSPMPYALARVVKWRNLEQAPEADAGGTTQVPGPRNEQVAPLGLMAGAGKASALSEEAESLFLAPGGTFLLDLQRHVCQGLEAQGFSQAAKVVTEEAGRLMQRLPGLGDLSFADGRPFADPATKLWLEEAAARVAGPGAGGDQPETWRKEATAHAAAGDFASSMRCLQEAVEQARNPAEAWRRRLAAARIYLDYHRPDCALPILQHLAEHAERVTLPAWDPGFCAQIWAGLVQAYEDLTPADQEEAGHFNGQAEHAKRKLFEYDLSLAAKLSQQTK